MSMNAVFAPLGKYCSVWSLLQIVFGIETNQLNPIFFKSFIDANKREEVERMNLTIYQVCKVERLSYCYCRHVVRCVTGVRKRKG